MNRLFWVASGLALLSVYPANAATLEFSNRGDWTALVTGLTNFDSGTGTAVGTTQAFNTSSGLIVTDLQITAKAGSMWDLGRANPSAAQTFFHWGVAPFGPILRTAVHSTANPVTARITFTTPVNAFGFDLGLGGLGGIPGTVTITPQGSASTTVTTLNHPNWAFYGIVSDALLFSYVDISVNQVDRYLAFDNISRGVYEASQTEPPPTETAEPATLLQIGLGIGTLSLMARRRLSGPTAA